MLKPFKWASLIVLGLLALAALSKGNYRDAVDTFRGEGTADKIENRTGIKIQNTGECSRYNPPDTPEEINRCERQSEQKRYGN